MARLVSQFPGLGPLAAILVVVSVQLALAVLVVEGLPGLGHAPLRPVAEPA